jgi:hypothetical protein
MPTFCRHNHLIQNCPICSREQAVEFRPIVSSGAPRSALPRERAPGATGSRASSTGRSSASRGGASGLRVSRLVRGADDGYRSALAPGLRSSSDAERLADELALAATRLDTLEQSPPGLYAELAGDEDIEERCWLAFLIAYLCPLETADPFSAIRAVRASWHESGALRLEGVELGPRTAHDPARGDGTVSAYQAWAARSGSQAAGFGGEPAWSPERRFERVFERLALPGFHRDARFDLLVTLGRTGAFDLRAAKLHLGGENEVTVAAKRALGIGDPLLLERRSADLASACGVPLEALDLGFYNWGRGERVTLGLGPGAEPSADRVAGARSGLGL